MSSALDRVRLAGQLARTLGPGWVAYRAKRAVELRTGLIERRLPAVAWDEVPLAAELTDSTVAEPEAYLAYRRAAAPPFFFSARDRADVAPLLRAWDGDGGGPIPTADDLQRGIFRYFAHATADLGDPPTWHQNPFTGQTVPADRHWSRLDDFAFGDIRLIWEPSRFGFTYDLVRAYWRTGDEAYADRFWRLVEHWQAANPPQCGPNWKCGQETSFRVMAWCFGLYGFLDAVATTPARVTMLAQTIAVSAHRIEAMLDYALSQKNNHGISEGMGLWTIGALFPEFRRAADWRRRGRQILERLARELIYDDGAFAQHSLNYQRLMLHDYVWSMRLGEVLGTPFSRGLYDRVGRAADLLYQLQDDLTGRVPCYGANDGSLILPLSNADYQDYRPVVQATRYLRTRQRTYPAGPWDEDLLWLFGAEAVRAAVDAPLRFDLRAGSGGYVTLKSATGFAFTRCATFRHRPGHADLLHVDLWWRGVNVALDPGSFSYNAAPPWQTALAETAEHNTVTVDGHSQMRRAGRFLWLPWASGHQRYDAASAGARLAYWEGEHDGYDRLPAPVHHLRGILRIGDEHWFVIDELRSAGEHDVRLHWLLPDVPYRREAGGLPGTTVVTLATSAGDFSVAVGGSDIPVRTSVVRAAPESTRGWCSPYYGALEPAISLACEARGNTVRLWTLFGPATATVDVASDAMTLHTGAGTANVVFGSVAGEPLIRAVSLSGEVADALEIAK